MLLSCCKKVSCQISTGESMSEAVEGMFRRSVSARWGITGVSLGIANKEMQKVEC